MSGVGNIAKFRHLSNLAKVASRFSKYQKASKFASTISKIRLAAGAIEISSGSLNILLKLTELRETPFGQALTEYLFYLELLSLSGELTAAIKNGLRKSAKKLVKHENEIRKAAKKEGIEDVDGLLDELYEVAGMASKKQLRLWKTNIKEGKFNCANCAMAVDRTLGGNSASALPWTYVKKIVNGKVVNKISYEDGTFLNVLEIEYGKKFIKNMSPDKIRQTLKPGQRGIVYGKKKEANIGHVFNVVNENGVIKFLDGQKTVKNTTDTQKADLIYDIYEFLPTNF